ncbi:MAG: tRNA 2-thiouridine(34) synthase MnmA [Acidobacteria bacterium]|nr:tRNA 2-thiouridine(34) synthase MnmA [Acidobacteriota bacterium]
MTKRVIVGISGGVDSAVSAYLLKQQGYEVWGVFMKNWEGEGEACTVEEDMREATLVASTLGIPLYSFNFSQDYWDRVFSRFLEEYKKGITPNPDILCNKEIKFKAFLEKCQELDADFIATGHYARIRPDDGALLKGLDPNKDQSYFLYAVPIEALRRCLFPVGELPKSQVRQIAREIGLPNADRKDSTGICFIGPGKFREFLGGYLGSQPGEIVDPEGRVLGRHEGLMYHTIGQRKGLGIGGPGEAWYVYGKDLENKRLLVAQGNEHPCLFAPGLIMDETHSLMGDQLEVGDYTAKIRYRQQDQACKVSAAENGGYAVHFEQPQRAISPGQSIVLYRGEVCCGGGVIQTAITQ